MYGPIEADAPSGTRATGTGREREESGAGQMGIAAGFGRIGFLDGGSFGMVA